MCTDKKVIEQEVNCFEYLGYYIAYIYIYIIKRDESRIMTGEIKFMRRTAEYTRLDHKSNLGIMR
jgi:hypothetical protein